MGASGDRTLEQILVRLERDAVRMHAIPVDVAAEARRATLRALRDAGGPSLRARTRSYFWTVVRRSAARSVSMRDVSDRFVLAAAVADLQAVERRPEVVWRQLRRDWAGRVRDDVLEEFGRRLCA